MSRRDSLFRVQYKLFLVIFSTVLIVSFFTGCLSGHSYNETDIRDSASTCEKKTYNTIASPSPNSGFSNLTLDFNPPHNYPNQCLESSSYTKINLDSSDIFTLFDPYILDRQYEQIHGKNSITFVYKTTDPLNYLTLQPGCLIFDTPYGNNIYDVFKCDPLHPNYNADKFNQVELESFSREDVLENLKSYLDTLGLSIGSNIEIYALPVNDLVAEQNRLINEDPLYQSIYDESCKFDNDIHPDCYYIKSSIDCDGIPLLSRHFFYETIEAGVSPTYIECLLHKDGIISLYISGFSPVASSNYRKIITCESAIKSVDKHLDYTIINNPLSIKNIELEMFPFGGMLLPAWVLELHDNNTVLWYYINAFTGELII